MASKPQHREHARAHISQIAHEQARRVETLPVIGRGRWSDIAPFVGVCREKWRQLANAGKAPAPIRLTERCTLYDFSQVHAWIADPLSYQADAPDQGRTAKRRSGA